MAMDGHFRLCVAWMPLTADPDGTETTIFCLVKLHPNKLRKDRPVPSERKTGAGL